jgi:hypothetical protein
MPLIDRYNNSIASSIAWWEVNRLVFNLYMLIVGFCSFFIGYVNIPIVYIFIVLTFNLIFTLSWIIELLVIQGYDSDQLTNTYTKIFIMVFYGFSGVSLLLYPIFPDVLDWAIEIWIN